MADIEELSVGISGVASWATGLRLMDGDILLVQGSKIYGEDGKDALRKSLEDDLRRIGVTDPKVLVAHSDLAFSIIGRS
ncbi:hypothetical protein [Rhizobium sp. NFR03]|uniref:hypothetical protein n=1 Tax=Rhizobium sp. NFR03 TaxID=1566263 RepID=UPI0008AC21B2|nr:hypothetical protein [Rhizobium sp. NFR03]SES05586.1 hypothetical protein SAMN03159406_01960 [Rhizobium sp. NFR03]